MHGYLWTPALVADPAASVRRLCAAVLLQTVVDLAAGDALAARRALQWVTAGGPWFAAYCLAVGVDPRRFRAVLLRRFARRVERIVAAHRASRKTRGRPRKHGKEASNVDRAATNLRRH